MLFNINKVVDEYSYVITGTVIDEKESNYSSTSVSTDNNYHVQSRVDHHQDQVIWYKTDSGKEDSVRLYNRNVEFRQGHSIALIYSRKTNQLMRVINPSTEYYWKINYKDKIRGMKDRIGAIVIGYPILALLAAFLILPFINIFTALFSGLKNALLPAHHYPATLIIRLLGVMVFVSILAFWLPYLIQSFGFTEYISYTKTVDLPALPFIGNLKPYHDLMVVLGGVSWLCTFLLLIREMSVNASITLALDRKSIALANTNKTTEP